MNDPVYNTVAEAVASIRVSEFGLGSSWVRFPKANLYVRIGRRYIGKAFVDTLELATVDVATQAQGTGVFRDLLAQFEELAAKQKRVLVVENVMSGRLKEAFCRRVARGDWFVLYVDIVPSYYRPWSQNETQPKEAHC